MERVEDVDDSAEEGASWFEVEEEKAVEKWDWRFGVHVRYDRLKQGS